MTRNVIMPNLSEGKPLSQITQGSPNSGAETSPRMARSSNILIDGKRPADERKMGGDLEVCKRFDRPLKRGEEFSTELSYDLTDAFTAAREGLIHVVEGRTRRLYLKIVVPAGKTIRGHRALLKYGGEERSELQELRYAHDRLEIEIKRPKLGAQYWVEWTW